MPNVNHTLLVERLRRDVLRLENYKRSTSEVLRIDGLQHIERAFPNAIFPTGAVHEFLTFKQEHVAATAGFASGIMSRLMQQNGVCLWISNKRKIFPRALQSFSLQPDHIVFVTVQQHKHVLWAAEEALKCKAVTSVIAEVPELTFMQSRRLQLAVEQSNVTGLVFRTDAKKLCTTACVTRWQIQPVVSQLTDGMPGVGFPRWNVSLLKVRNGRPGNWIVEWNADRYAIIEQRNEVNELKRIQRAG